MSVIETARQPSKPGRVLVTGADGFVGHAVCRTLAERGVFVRGVVHGTDPRIRVPGVEYRTGIDLAMGSLPPAVIEGTEVLVHLAARVHLRDRQREDLEPYLALNSEGTGGLAQQAAESRIKRFVYMSSIAVNGGATTRSSFTETDAPRPQGPYALSKRLGEERLLEVAERTGLEAIVLRPPMVYGPYAKANFLRLLRLISSGWPLPLAGISNRRHFIGLGNLADAVVRVSLAERALAGVYLVADQLAVSTTGFVHRIAGALGRTASLFYVPRPLLRRALTAYGGGKAASALCDDLQIAGTRLRTELGWTAPEAMDAELRRAAEWYMGLGAAVRGDA